MTKREAKKTKKASWLFSFVLIITPKKSKTRENGIASRLPMILLTPAIPMAVEKE